MIDSITTLIFVIFLSVFIIIIILCLIGDELKKMNSTMEKFLNRYIANHPDEKK